MKKLLASLLIAAAAIPASAQTEFRHIDFEQALSAAKVEKKLVFIDFYTTWCGPCKKMATTVFPQPEVGEYMNATFIPVKYDAEAEGQALAAKYGVRSYPTYVVINADGKEVTRFSGAMPADRFISKMQAQLDPDQTPERIRERYIGGERSPLVVNAYAMQFMEQRNETEGYKIIDSYWHSLSDADRLKSENLFLFTTYTYDLDSPRGLFMREHLNDFATASDRSAVTDRYQALLNTRLSQYFSGYMWKEGNYNADTFAAFKKEINDLGMNVDGKKEVVFDFIEKRPALDDKAYLAFCDTRYKDLDPQMQNLLIYNLTRLLNTSDPEIRSGISAFIRSRLATMTPMAIQIAGRSLSDLEK